MARKFQQMFLRERWLIALVAAALLGLMSHGTFAGSGDEPHYLVISHSIAFDHDLDLGNNYGPHEPLIGNGTLAPEAHARPGTGGVLRPVHDIGMPALFAPYVRVVRPLTEWLVSSVPPAMLQRAKLTPGILYRHFISLGMIAVMVLVAISLVALCHRAGAERRFALVAVGVLCLSPPLQIFAILFFTELLSSLLLVIALLVLCAGDRVRVRDGVAGGLALGLLPLIHIRNAPLALALGGLALASLLRGRQNRPAAALASVLAVAVTVRLWVTHHLWGTWVTSPHASPGSWTGLADTVREAGVRLAGLAIDQEFGLLPYCPIAALAVLGIAPLWTRHRQLAITAGITAGFYLLCIALPLTNVHGWTGGWSPPARFLVPVLPLAAVPLAFALPRLPRAVLVLALALQIAISAYTWQHPKVLWNDGDGRAGVGPALQVGPALARGWDPSGEARLRRVGFALRAWDPSAIASGWGRPPVAMPRDSRTAPWTCGLPCYRFQRASRVPALDRARAVRPARAVTSRALPARERRSHPRAKPQGPHPQSGSHPQGPLLTVPSPPRYT